MSESAEPEVPVEATTDDVAGGEPAEQPQTQEPTKTAETDAQDSVPVTASADVDSADAIKPEESSQLEGKHETESEPATTEQPTQPVQPQEPQQPQQPGTGGAVIIQFTILPERHSHAEAFPPDVTIDYVKTVLGQAFNISDINIRLSIGDRELDDREIVSTFKSDALSIDPINMAAEFDWIAQKTSEKQEYKMPDVLEVRVGWPDDEKGPKTVFVKVEREDLVNPKPYLGGFRHKQTRRIFHHAASQTKRKTKKNIPDRNHRETQTVDTVTRSQQTTRESGTQMDRSDLCLDHGKDRVITARPYITAAELEKVRQAKAKALQCFLRQCFAWRRVQRLREENAASAAEAKRLQEIKEMQQKADHERQIQRRSHPRTVEDFNMLKEELQAWRLHETARIKESDMSLEDQKLELEELLAKEVKLLQTIDRLKISATKANKRARTKEVLEKMASPKEWVSREGDLVEVETPFTTRAKELVELYSGLSLTEVTREERTDILLHCKYTVDEFDCELTRDILRLISREEDLIRRNRPDSSFTGMRRRLSNLFLQFLETPEFNPEAANFSKVPFIQVDTQKMPYIRTILKASQPPTQPSKSRVKHY